VPGHKYTAVQNLLEVVLRIIPGTGLPGFQMENNARKINPIYFLENMRKTNKEN